MFCNFHSNITLTVILFITIKESKNDYQLINLMQFFVYLVVEIKII